MKKTEVIIEEVFKRVKDIHNVNHIVKSNNKIVFELNGERIEILFENKGKWEYYE
jgi:hypothetical protein